jgi:hypothetical protein
MTLKQQAVVAIANAAQACSEGMYRREGLPRLWSKV